MNIQLIALLIVIAGVCGLIIGMLMGGSGIAKHIITGIIGGFLAIFCNYLFKFNLGITDAQVSQMVISAIGATLVTVILQLVI